MGRELGGRKAAGRSATARVLATATAAVVTMIGPLGMSACTGRTTPDRVRPINGSAADAATGTAPPTTAAATGPGSTAAAPGDPAVTADGAAGTDTAPQDPAADAVDQLLSRYDRALTDLSAQPAAAADPAHPLHLAWSSVVAPGTALAADLPAAITARARDGVVVEPGAQGLAYRHHALEVVPAEDGSVGFTWCGWSPGIARDVATREVVDDGVGHAHGTGRARPGPVGWVLDSLDQSDLVVLAPGTPDPCPAEVRGAGR